MYKYLYKRANEYSNLIMISDGEYLLGLRFETESYKYNDIGFKEEFIDIFKDTFKYLDAYFNKELILDIPKIKILNLTPFKRMVYDILSSVEFGSTITYNDIAKTIANKKGIKKMSAQAVGSALKNNPINIIIPCHRVIGIDKIGGYNGGINNKLALLKHEGIIK